MAQSSSFKKFTDIIERSQFKIVVGAVLLLLLSGGLIYLIIIGKTRINASPIVPSIVEATSTVKLVARRLDGVMVPVGEEALMPRAIMIENEVNARPLSGPAKASLVIEAPVEGGIPRLIAFFNATDTISEIGPVRSARPYFVDWAKAWNAMYFHVGGSPEALALLNTSSNSIPNFDEIHAGRFFWRSSDRLMPHNAYTNSDLIKQATMETASSSAPVTWHFQDASTSTAKARSPIIKVTYGGPYNVAWKFDQERRVYVRYQAENLQQDADGAPVESQNVIVIKTDGRVFDEVGRLHLRTTGSGDAIAYRDGNKYILRWKRAAGEPMKFESKDGKEFLLNRGRTWIEVTTDDRVFAGLEK